MRIVVQRVSQAHVDVGGQTIARIGGGLLLLVGFEKGDGMKEVQFMADRVLNLRIFADGLGKMNLNVRDVKGEVLSISQFTLAAHMKKGRRPDFTNAEGPGKAKALYESFNALLDAAVPVATGEFGAMMDLHSVNQGPVTIILEKTRNELG